jgi:serine-type D-Ala-D-Ala carboxypeptidase (penicillin-binding protein 5/6)
MKTMYKLRWCFLAMVLLACVGWAASAQAASTSKSSNSKSGQSAGSSQRKAISRNPYLGAIVVDAVTGKVLFEDQADAKGYPASVLKLMDLLIILEKIEQGQLSLQDQVTASAKAAQTGGSQVWLAHNETFSVDELLYALMVQSANDAAVALAEKVGGSTQGFLELMNKRARELGMNNTTFHSVHGLPPSAGQEHDLTTARDLSLLCRELLKHANTLRYTSTREHLFRQGVPGKTVAMRTHNHLLARVEGCDGFKTGYIAVAGYSIAVTASRNGQRVIVVVLDSIDLKTRDSKAAELVAKGFAALPGKASPAPVSAATTPAKKK